MADIELCRIVNVYFRCPNKPKVDNTLACFYEDKHRIESDYIPTKDEIINVSGTRSPFIVKYIERILKSSEEFFKCSCEGIDIFLDYNRYKARYIDSSGHLKMSELSDKPSDDILDYPNAIWMWEKIIMDLNGCEAI